LIVTWLGLSLAFYTPFPVGFLVTSVAFAGYLSSQLVRHSRRDGTTDLRVPGIVR
jgi:zinc/manganese transport system permease protein